MSRSLSQRRWPVAAWLLATAALTTAPVAAEETPPALAAPAAQVTQPATDAGTKAAGAAAALVPPPLPSLVPVEGPTELRTLALEGQPVGPMLTLDEAFQLALRNPALEASRQQVEQTELLRDRVLTGWHPTVTAVGTYTHYDSEIPMGFPDFSTLKVDMTKNPPFQMETSQIILQKQDSFGGLVQFQAPIFVGPLLPALDDARDARILAGLQYGHGERSFLLGVAATYYGTVGAGEALQVAKSAVQTAQKHYESAARLFEVGQANKLVVLQAQIALVSAQQKLTAAETGYKQARRALQIMLGLTGERQLQHPSPPARPTGGETELLALAREKRTDYHASRVAVEMATRGDEKALWKYAPVLAANGMYRVSDSENFAGNNATWQVGLTLSLPLYDGGTRTIDRIEAASKLRQSEEQLRSLDANLATQISQALKEVDGAESELLAMRLTVALAREGVVAARASFDAGMVTNLEVIDANQKQFEAELGLVGTQIKLDLARLQLVHATGLFDPLGRGPTGNPTAGRQQGGR